MSTITTMDLQNTDGLSYLKTITNSSIDLILTDPPYIISRDSGMNTHYNTVKANEVNQVECVKTEEEWNAYKIENNILNDENKEKYIKYGTVYGKKYCVKTDYGEWDSQFTMDILEQFISEYYNKLRIGGTLIIFFDIWKITPLKELMVGKLHCLELSVENQLSIAVMIMLCTVSLYKLVKIDFILPRKVWH
jgi:site-specific DNA-methyltransferase (adenine-specific)